MPDGSYPLTDLIETLQGDWTGRNATPPGRPTDFFRAGPQDRELQINRSYLCRFLRFTLIAPDSAEAVLAFPPADGGETIDEDEAALAEAENALSVRRSPGMFSSDCCWKSGISAQLIACPCRLKGRTSCHGPSQRITVRKT
jgi:hypothetical protein